MIGNMPEITGRSLQEWFRVLSAAGLDSHGPILALLKGEYGVTHGFANTISILYRQQLAGGAPSGDDLVRQQYTGAKSGLLPIYRKILQTVQEFGPDIEVAPKKSYVSLRRNKQFAIVQASTRDRVDLGLNLKGLESTRRLEGGNIFGGMCTHRVSLGSPEEVDGEVTSWLEQAYKLA